MDYIIAAWDSFINLVKMFRISDALDVILVSFIIYSAIKLVRETRAEQLVKGIIVLLVVWGASNLLKLYMLKTLLTYFFQFSVMALLVVFSRRFGVRLSKSVAVVLATSTGLWCSFHRY